MTTRGRQTGDRPSDAPASGDARPAVFLDRDGTLIQDCHYLSDPDLVRLFEGAVEAVRAMKRAGYAVVLVTNQSGIGRGYFTENEYRAVHAELCPATRHGGRRVGRCVPLSGGARRVDGGGDLPEALSSSVPTCGAGTGAGSATFLVRRRQGVGRRARP